MTAALIFGWAAVHAYIGIYYGLLHFQRRTDGVHLSYSVLSIGMAIYSSGAAKLTSAESVASGTHGMRLAHCGVAIAVGAIVALAYELTGNTKGPARTAAFAWAALGFGASAAGLFVDAGLPNPARTGGWLHTTYYEPRMLPLGVLWLCGAMVFALIAVVRLLRHIPRDPNARLLAVAGGATFLAGIHDTLSHVLAIGNPRLLPHAAMLSAPLISQVLAHRFQLEDRALQTHTDELRHRYRELQETQAAIVQKEQLAAVGELSSVIANEVRSPMAALKRAVARLREAGADESARRVALRDLDRENDRLNNLVTDLLAYSRPATPHAEPIDVGALVRDAVDAALEDPHQATIAVTVDAETWPLGFESDRQLLKRALGSVITATVYGVGQATSLAVSTSTRRARGVTMLVVEVLAKGDRADAHPDRQDEGGGALRLAIVERVVRAHGGDLIVARTPGAVQMRLAVPSMEARSTSALDASQ